MKKFLVFLILIALLIAGYFILTNDKTKSDLTKVKVGEVTHSIFYAPQYAAHSLGYFKDEGLDVDFILTAGVVKKKWKNFT